MLNYIECEKFLEKRICFNSSLNIVVGDKNSTNSIGKSTLLKVIDFIFGGETFLKHSADAIQVLGHHTYRYSLTFESNEYILSRSTEYPNTIIYYPSDSAPKTLELSDYTNWLKQNYCSSIDNISFRKIVSPVSRVWGKELPDVTKPLHSHRAESGSECIDYLISIFERYGAISDLTIRLGNLTSEKAALNKAFSKKIISKINKSQYKENQAAILRANGQLDFIRDQLSTLALSINELIDEEVLNLKFEKDQLIKLRTILAAEIERTRSNLEPNKSVSAKAFSALIEIIPQINVSKLEKIESFHKGLVKVLHKQIKEKEEELQNQLNSVNAEIEGYNAKISSHISQAGNPTHIVDAVADLTLHISKCQAENSHYDQAASLRESIKNLSVELERIKLDILSAIEMHLNADVAKLVEFIYQGKRTSPELLLYPKSYSFAIPNDTGTGKAYASLISLDASLLRHTKVPFLIHDSFLFKNIEDNAIANMLIVYKHLKQQSFIALDGSVLDSPVAKPIIFDAKVVELHSSKLLYTVDWRNKEENKPSAKKEPAE